MECIIVDYGTGNIQSVHNALEHLGHSVNRSNKPSDFETCDCVIFPGQGAFGPAIEKLQSLNLTKALQSYIESKKPFIGICLGFQLLFETSEEANNTNGLNAFKGTFKQFETKNVVVPHMGWNKIKSEGPKSCLSQFDNEEFYFVHSYYLNQTNEPSYAVTNYDVPFVSAIANETQLITQFHPEKSGNVGLALLNQFFKNIQ